MDRKRDFCGYRGTGGEGSQDWSPGPGPGLSHVGRPDNRLSTGNPCELATHTDEWQPKHGDSPQLRLDIVPTPLLPRHRPLIKSTGDPRVHDRRRASSAVAFQTRTMRMRAIVVVRIPTPIRILSGRRSGV
jgi:hypothetical protein